MGAHPLLKLDSVVCVIEVSSDASLKNSRGLFAAPGGAATGHSKHLAILLRSSSSHPTTHWRREVQRRQLGHKTEAWQDRNIAE